MFILHAACISNKGLIRAKQEDNLLFLQRYLPYTGSDSEYRDSAEVICDKPIVFSVFDGIGGEEYGELASYAAARSLWEWIEKNSIASEKDFLLSVCREMNAAVFQKHKELLAGKMGTTVSMLLFADECVYSCNLGDSRTYRLRGKEFSQLSSDHLMTGGYETHRKAPLSQYLGVDPTEMRLVPHLSCNTIEHGDQYLICTDGLTDMVGNLEIETIMETSSSAESCVRDLTDRALMKGGRDNITVIVCEVL